MDEGVDRDGDASELDDVGVAGGVPADGVGHTDGAFLVDLAESVDLAVPADVVLGGHVDDDVVPDDDVVLDEHVDDGVAAEVLLEVVVPDDVVLGGHVDDDVVDGNIEAVFCVGLNGGRGWSAANPTLVFLDVAGITFRSR